MAIRHCTSIISIFKKTRQRIEKTKVIKNIHVILLTKEERNTINVNFKKN